MQLIVFAGTKNGRDLSLMLAKSGHQVHVSSASAYGDRLLEGHKNLSSSYGKLDGQGIEALINNYEASAIIDSTHPYATEISKNLIEVTKARGIPLLRYERARAVPATIGQHFPSIELACNYLKNKEGQVLFTTGVNDLKKIADTLDHNRIYARILPIGSSVALGKASGLGSNRLIAMNPPFTLEENLAHIRDYKINYLVTKDSGKEGNIEEKIQATHEMAIELVVIDRPELAFEHVVYREEDVKKYLETL